jgi:hypothetical protein
MNRRLFCGRIAGLLALSITGTRLRAQARSVSQADPTRITVYKSSTCGCCAKWVDHIRSEGFAAAVYDDEDMDQRKDRLGVPKGVRSCHTAQVDRYLIEGHVPASDIRRLVAEQPKVAGLAVPDMPPLTPGMAPPGVEPRDYVVVAFQADGATQTFARH